MAYTKYNTSRVKLYSFSVGHTFYGDYYYDSYRDGTKMYYRLKTVVTFVPVSGYGGNYQNPINAQFVVNSKNAGVKQLKGSTPSNEYWWNEISWEAESDWIDSEKTSGTVTASTKIYDTANSSWLNYTYNMNLAVIPAASELGTIDDFDLERSFSVPFTKYSDLFTETLEIKYLGTLIKSIKGYTPSSAINLSVSEILKAYKALGSSNRGAFTVNLITKSGDTEVGTSTKSAIGNARGTTKIKANGAWKNAIPFVKVNGVWKKAVAFTKVNGVWKRGNP